MSTDSILDEIRSIRDAIAAENDYDVVKIAHAISANQVGTACVERKPRRPKGWVEGSKASSAGDSDAA